MCSTILVSFRSTGRFSFLFLSMKIVKSDWKFYLFNWLISFKYHTITWQVTCARVLFVFLFFFQGFVDFWCDIGGTSDVSGLVFFCKGCQSWSVEVRTLQFYTCKSVYRSSVFHFCRFVFLFLHFTFYLLLRSSCVSTLVLYHFELKNSFNVICLVLSWSLRFCFTVLFSSISVF